jgi:hypothetical protein
MAWHAIRQASLHAVVCKPYAVGLLHQPQVSCCFEFQHCSNRPKRYETTEHLLNVDTHVRQYPTTFESQALGSSAHMSFSSEV